jgi:phage FluMu protein gp41
LHLVNHFTTPQAAGAGTVAGMNNTPATSSHPQAPSPHHSPNIESLATLQLVDGLPAEMGGKTIKYRTVRLRETTVADERAAVRMAERVVMVDGQHKLMLSESDFRFALTLRHIESLECDGHKLHQATLDLDVLGKISNGDLQLIEERIVLIELAAKVRYGVITAEEFAEFISGKLPATEAAASPQPLGQTPALGEAPGGAGAGPELLANFSGAAAQGAA